MPIYEYKCSECQTKFEILHRSITKIEDVNCPSCKSENIKKLMSTFSSTVIGGFATGYASPSASEAKPPCETGGGCCGGGACSHS
jgi:putative FmdB family regulatory protein